MSKNNEKYSLLTAISMIVGICIGSGIFFKADDVLRDTGGNVGLGILIFIIGALGIIFGSLSLSELAVISRVDGGLIGYFEEFFSPKIASGFAWFQVFMYLPAINVVVTWVAGIYTLQMLGIPYELEFATFVGTVYLMFIFALNFISMRFGGIFQKLSTIIKLIPFLLIFILAIFNIQVEPSVPNIMKNGEVSGSSFAWLAALAPMAFSYEGWTVILNISPEIKNREKNIPLALLIGPVIVLGGYLAYFIGLVRVLGVDNVLTLGDEAIYIIGSELFGGLGGPIITLIILFSVLGVSNGLTIGSIHMPQVLAEKRMLSSKLKEKEGIDYLGLESLIISLYVSLVWICLNYLTQKFNVFNGGDISEIVITFSYLCYLFLYIKILRLRKKGAITKSFKNGIAPMLGIVSSLMILLGSIISSPLTSISFIGLCVLIGYLGSNYYSKSELNSDASEL